MDILFDAAELITKLPVSQKETESLVLVTPAVCVKNLVDVHGVPLLLASLRLSQAVMASGLIGQYREKE